MHNPNAFSLDPRTLDEIMSVGGDQLLSKILNLYLVHCPGSLARLTAALRTKDLQEIQRSAHKVGGMGANIGAHDFQSIAARIEIHPMVDDALLQLIDQLVEMQATIILEIRTILERGALAS